MRTRRGAALAVAAAAMVAGCGSAHPAAAHKPALTPTLTPAVATSSPASSDARLLVDAVASGASASLLAARSLVAGPVMTYYVSEQLIQAEAAAALGQPVAPESVTAIGAGTYQMCLPQGQGCQTVSALQTDSTGRVTGMNVDGQSVASRLAAGPSDRANGLALTNVESYLYTETGQVGVTFVLRNNGNSGVSQDGYLPVFVTSGGARLQPDLSSSLMRSTDPLAPGQSVTCVAVFDTRVFTGTFIVGSNGGYQTLVSSRLTKPAS